MNTEDTEDNINAAVGLLTQDVHWRNMNEYLHYLTVILRQPMVEKEIYIRRLISSNSAFNTGDTEQIITTVAQRKLERMLNNNKSIRYGGRQTTKRNKGSKSNKRNKRNKTNKTHSVYTLGRFTRGSL